MKKIISMMLVAMMIVTVSALPMQIAAETLTPHSAPYGYSETDYNQLLAYLEQTNSAGVKNGQQLNDYYNPDDPTSWYGVTWVESYSGMKYIEFISFSAYYYPERNLVGELNLSGLSEVISIGLAENSLTSVIVSNCPKLEEMCAADNQLTTFSVSNCPRLGLLWCENNNLSEIQLSGLNGLSQYHCYNNPISEFDATAFPNLRQFRCEDTNISELDLSNNPILMDLRLTGTNVTELDISHNNMLTDLFCDNTNISELDLNYAPNLQRLFCNNTLISELDMTNAGRIEKLRCYDARLTELNWHCIASGLSIDIDLYAQGSGYVGTDWVREYVDVNYWENWVTAVATPAANSQFIGWYDKDGELVSTEQRLFLGQDIDLDVTELYARFTQNGENPTLYGDVNNDGVLSGEDAVIIARVAMGIHNINNLDIADFNRDGNVTLADAVGVLRVSMGLN